MAKKSIVDTAIEEAGGGSALAKAFTKRGTRITPQGISDWKRKGRVPAERVLALEEILGGRITRHELRPDLYPVGAQ